VNLLVTGFEPWDAHAVNPSGEVARELGGAVLPVDFRAADRELRRILARRKPEALLMLGLAPTRTQLALEAVALNVDHHEQEGKNEAFRRPIQEGGPLAVECRLPLNDLQRRLRKSGIPSGISHHAGTFLCNHVFYRGLTWMDGPCGFVHVPPFRALPRTRMVQAVRLILHALADRSPAATPSARRPGRSQPA
jgi:pyroglutamyl-peptidase